MLEIKIEAIYDVLKSRVCKVFVNGIFYCYSIANKSYMIPSGTYTAIYDEKGSNGLSLRLLDVPNRSGIEIHIANYSSQLKGCFAFGYQVVNGNLFHSKLAIEALFLNINRKQPVKVVFKDLA